MTPVRRVPVVRRAIVAALACATVAAACGGRGDDAPSPDAAGADDAAVATTTTGAGPVTLTLLAHDSFTPSEGLLEEFTRATGIGVEVARGGDAGELVAKAVLTAGAPEGDVLWGVDDTLLARVIDARVFAPYESPELAALDPAATALVPGRELTPVDTGDVCINYDVAWFADRGIPPPLTLRALTSPTYRDLLVVPSPLTSSPGFAFLVGTVAEFGDGWRDWWRDLRANGVQIVNGWTEAYYDEFSGSGGASGTGQRPIVVSYGSSPPAEVIFADPVPDEAPTAVAALTCVRQVEFVGVLRGTPHEAEARRLVDFLVGARFQADLPLAMFVYPVRLGVALPDAFVRHSLRPERPLAVDPRRIAAERTAWLEDFAQIVLR